MAENTKNVRPQKLTGYLPLHLYHLRHPFIDQKWFSKLLVSCTLLQNLSTVSKTAPDISLAAFGRKEIEIAEVGYPYLASRIGYVLPVT